MFDNGSQIDTLTDPETKSVGYTDDTEYTYRGITLNDLQSNGALAHSFKFVVTAKTLDFNTVLGKTLTDKATVGLVDENSKLEYGKDFEFTITPEADYAFNDVLNKVEVSVYDEKGKVAVDASEQELTFSNLNITREGLYNFKLAAEDNLTKKGVNSILKAFYDGVNAAYLAVSNTFDEEDLNNNIVKTGEFVEANVTKESAGKGSVEAKGLTTPTSGSNQGKDFIKPGTPVVLTATPEDGYKLVDVEVVDSYGTANNLVLAKKAYVDVSEDGTTATVLFDADVKNASFTEPIKITPVFEKTATITVTNDGGTTGVKGSLSVDGKEVTEAKVNSNDDFELTLKLTNNSVKEGKILNPALKTTPLYVKTNAGTTTDAADVIVLTYDRTDENGNFVFKIDFNVAGSAFDSNFADNGDKIINFSTSVGNIFKETTLSAGSVRFNEYTLVAPAADEAKAYFYFNDLKALGSAGTVEVFGKDGNEEYTDNQTGQALKVGETYQVKITPDSDVIQPLLTVYCGRSEGEELNFTTNYKKDTDGKDTDVVESYTFEFTAKNTLDNNDELTYDNYIIVFFGARQSKYVTVEEKGDGFITLEAVNGKEWKIEDLDASIKNNEKTNVYLVPNPMENLESLTVYTETIDILGETVSKEVETTLVGNAYKVTLEQGANYVIEANFKEAAKSYPVINTAPEIDKDQNNGYLILTLPALGQTEAYAGDEIAVSAFPNDGYKVGHVLAYVGEAADGAIVELDENNEGTFTVPENVTDYVKFAVTFIENDTPDPEYPTANDWHKNEDGTWSFINEAGELVTGWQNAIKGWEGQWFYFDENGVMVTGWKTGIPGWNSAWFYFDPTTGVMKTDWQNNIPGWEGQWFFFDKGTGEMFVNRWYQNWDGNYYYFGSNGVMLTNTYTPDGYYVNADGVWVA